MNKHWDRADVAFDPAFWREVLRVLKPGGHVIAMGGTRTYHRLACAIEDAGFEIRDCVMWVYATGFPKSHDVSKGIDKAAGAEREVVDASPWDSRKPNGSAGVNSVGLNAEAGGGMITAPATDAARQWQGWGTALKPAWEPCVLARKPLSEKTVAANVLTHGTGAINIDACRVETTENLNGGGYDPSGKSKKDLADATSYATKVMQREFVQPTGRWPANLIHDGSEEVLEAFPETESGSGDKHGRKESSFLHSTDWESLKGTSNGGDSGSAARFFYTAKADQDDRLGSKHPTVKPVDLMQYLVRLITPPGGTVLDPFAGTGSTGEAAWREGMRAVLIECEPEYLADIRRRMVLMLAGPDERARESLKARGQVEHDPGPLFQWKSAWDRMWSQPFCLTASERNELELEE